MHTEDMHVCEHLRALYIRCVHTPSYSMTLCRYTSALGMYLSIHRRVAKEGAPAHTHMDMHALF